MFKFFEALLDGVKAIVALVAGGGDLLLLLFPSVFIKQSES